jgi:1-acyl-sn-glycerol-3-phosphate acyltransferase
MEGNMKQLILNIYYWLMFIIVTLLSLILLPLFLLVYIVLGRTVDSGVRLAISFYGWTLVKIIPFFAPVRVESQTGKVPLPAILVANHNSAIDPYLFGALLIDACFFSTWAFKIPIYGYLMRLARYVDANEGWEKVCQKSAALLQSGTSLIIWPEGHRSRDGKLGRFKNGAFALAVETGYPLVPVCILGSGKFLPPGKGILSPSLIKLVLLDPIYPDQDNDQQQEIIKLRNTVHEVIEKALQEDKNQLPTNTYSKGFERGEKC